VRKKTWCKLADGKLSGVFGSEGGRVREIIRSPSLRYPASHQRKAQLDVNDSFNSSMDKCRSGL
jgi:hypothetical protein